MSSFSPRVRNTCLWLLLLVSYWLLYQQGLPGGFIFDDAPNLGGLSAIASGQFSELLSFSLKGIAGPSGRPLSLFTFALQHASWPADPAAFKRVNMIIHALNASLLYWLFVRLQQLLGKPRNGVAMAAAALWLLWPIQVSSVLYVVQRMTLLSASCMFLGLALHTEARIRQIKTGASLLTHALFLLALFSGIVIGILCKENAIIFPLLVLALEATLLSQLTPAPRAWRILLGLPIAAFLVYLLLNAQQILRFDQRSFTLAERVLTEARVLWMYLGQIALPSAGSLKFLYDNYPVSTSLFSPISTALAWAAWLIIGMLAWISRRQHPVFSFAVLFFLASHALESTIIPLELVFEHRNYIGSASIAFAMCAGLASATFLRPSLKIAASVLYFSAMALVSYNVTSLWGKPLIQKKIWAESNPRSARAQLGYAGELMMQGHATQSAQILDAATSNFPDSIAFPLARAELGCYSPELRVRSLSTAQNAAQGKTEDSLSAFAFLDRLTVAFSTGLCPSYSAADLLELIQAAASNPAFRVRQADLVLMEGIVYSAEGDAPHARERLQYALALDARPSVLIQAASWEMGNGNMHDARRYIDMLQALKDSQPLSYIAVQNDIELLETRYKELETAHPKPST